MDNREPFFLIVDDGAFRHVYPCGRSTEIPFTAYVNILRLTKEFDIQIVLACTASFMDVKRVTPGAKPHADSGRLIDFLGKHTDRIILADHGYSHRWRERYVEFHDYRRDERRPEPEQKQHVEWCARIYQSLGLPFPEIFVAPAHGWEPGVTDRLYATQGVRFLSAVLWLKRTLSETGFPAPRAWPLIFQPHLVYPDSSPWLTILPRQGLLIPSHLAAPGRTEWLKARLAVTARSRAFSYLLHRHQALQPHNYMAHIMNFATDEAFRGWVRFLMKISAKVTLVPTFAESLVHWRALSTGNRRRAPALPEGQE